MDHNRNQQPASSKAHSYGIYSMNLSLPSLLQQAGNLSQSNPFSWPCILHHVKFSKVGGPTLYILDSGPNIFYLSLTIQKHGNTKHQRQVHAGNKNAKLES